MDMDHRAVGALPHPPMLGMPNVSFSLVILLLLNLFFTMHETFAQHHTQNFNGGGGEMTPPLLFRGERLMLVSEKVRLHQFGWRSSINGSDQEVKSDRSSYRRLMPHVSLLISGKSAQKH
jgi:hypothetical protein